MKPTSNRAANRREFIRGALAGLCGVAALPTAHTFAADRRAAPTLDAAFRLLNFNPDAGDAFTVVWMADIHYGVGNAQQILPPMLAELRGMNPRPAFIGVIGDLILTASTSFGTVPGAAQRLKAIEEFRAFQSHYEELKKLAPVKLTLGNHDTYPGEENLGLFRAVFGAEPVTHAFKEKGVTFAIANGGSCGLLGDRQQKWLASQVKTLHRPGGTLVTAVHQPSVGRVVRERGIAAAIREAYADLHGDLWVVGGHEHHNDDRRFRLPHGQVLTQATITAGNPKTWGTELPGYWVWCFAGGKLAGRVFRRIGDESGFAIAPAATNGEISPVLLPFEDTRTLWKVMVGEGDEPYRRTTKAAWCLNYWAYVRELVYEFPLKVANGHARRCATLMDSPEGGKPMRLAVAANKTDWKDVTDSERTGACTVFTIPQTCLDAGTLRLKMENCAVSGFALME